MHKLVVEADIPLIFHVDDADEPDEEVHAFAMAAVEHEGMPYLEAYAAHMFLTDSSTDIIAIERDGAVHIVGDRDGDRTEHAALRGVREINIAALFHGIGRITAFDEAEAMLRGRG